MTGRQDVFSATPRIMWLSGLQRFPEKTQVHFTCNALIQSLKFITLVALFAYPVPRLLPHFRPLRGLAWVVRFRELLLQSTITLMIRLKSSYELISSLGRRFRFFYPSFCSWQGSGIGRWRTLQFRHSALLILARDQAFFKPPFLISVVFKRRRFYAFPGTTDFYSTTAGERLYEKAPLTSLEFVDTRTTSFPQLKPLKHMWLWPLNCV